MKGKQQRKPSNKRSTNRTVVRKQPRKDSDDKRVNYDNTRESKFEKDMRCVDKSNDVSWYAKNPEVFRAAGSIGFVNVSGKQMPWLNAQAVPGIMTFGWTPSLGGGDQTAVNQAANSIYSFVVHANSRNQSYDAPDLMMMILAGANLFSTIAHGLRAYGTMRRFDGLNEYTPASLVQAMGFNYNSLKANLANMWFDLNHLIAQTSQIWIPNDIPLIERWWWMNTNIYMDGSSVKAQYYMYVPEIIYQLSETGSEEGTSLVLAERPNTTTPGEKASFISGNLWNWSDYVKLVQQLLDALIGAQDRGIILGDVLKAYGTDHIYALTPITSDYVTEPTYNQEVLSQFENLIAFPFVPGNIVQSQVNRSIYQKANPDLSIAISSLSGTAQNTWETALKATLPTNGVLNFHFMGQPTPEQIMVATRMMVLGTAIDDVDPDGGLDSIYPMYTGSEYCTSITIWYKQYGAGLPNNAPAQKLSTRFGTGWHNYFQTVDSVKYAVGAVYFSEPLSNSYATLWTAFDWAPAIYTPSIAVPDEITAAAVAANMKASTPYGVILDYDNYSVVTVNELRKLHVAALLSEFGVPKI